MFNRDRDKTKHTLYIEFTLRRHSVVTCHGNTKMDRPVEERTERKTTTRSIDDFPILEGEKRSLRTTN